MNLKDATLRAAITKRLKELLDEADKTGRVETLALLIAAHDALGVKTVDVRLPDGTKVARATLPTPQPGVTVDEAAFLDWVRRERPDELVEAVRESFRRAALKDLKVVGGEVVNKRTGEVVPWARVRPAADKPTSFTVTFVDEGREAIEEAWRDGRINPLELVTRPEIEAGGDAA